MQLSNSQDRRLGTSADRVLQVLEDIIVHIQILPDFQFSHPNHPSLCLESDIVNSIQQLSNQRQDKYLRWRLGGYLCGIYEAGSGSAVLLQAKTEAASLPIEDGLAQNTALGIHSPFYKRLDTQNTGKGYFEPGWRVLRQESDGLFAVRKDGLTIHVGDRHLHSFDCPVAIGDEVAIHLPSNRIEQGCYVALSNVGPVDSNREQAVNVYFNLQPENLISLMGALTTALNALKIPFTFKVPYNFEECDRPDSGVLSLYQTDWAVVDPTLRSLYPSLQRLLRPEVPLFTKYLSPGLALAEQPIKAITPQESFGMHRFQAIAQGLIQAWRHNENAAAARMSFISQSLSEHHIDPRYPYLNSGTEDVYACLGAFSGST
jgi:hypothetical protein